MELTQKEVDQNLDYINQQQEELNKILDAYEKQIQDVYDDSNLQQPLQLADVQREKAYGLAEILNNQLDDVNRNLNAIVEEMNATTTAQQSDASENDVVRSCRIPNFIAATHANLFFLFFQVRNVVRILNSHLATLQWIDTTSTHLQGKLQEVVKLQEDAIRTQEPSI